MTTAELLLMLGGPEASAETWAELVRRYGTRLWAVCRAVAGEELADDAFQNALITIRRRAGRFRPGADPEASALAWMVTVAHHAAIDLIRSERRRTVREGARMAQDPSSTPEPDLREDRDASRLALQALEQLPERHRQVIRLRLLGGLDARATASVLGCPPEQVRVRLARALQLLRERCPRACGALSVAALSDSIHQAALPPAVLPASATHLATTAFSVPLAASISLGAIMTVSTIALGVVASTSLILVSAWQPARAAAADVAAAPTPVAATLAPAPTVAPEPSALRLAQEILAMPALRKTITLGVRHLAESSGVHGSDEAMTNAVRQAIDADSALWEGLAKIMVTYADSQALTRFRDYLKTDAGRHYLELDQHLQEAVNGDAMQKAFGNLMAAAATILNHPHAALPAADATDPALALARTLATASGYEGVIAAQIEQSLEGRFPAQSKIAVRSALDQALGADAHWQDAMLRVYGSSLSPQEMDEQYAYFTSLDGRRMAASLPIIVQEVNRLLFAQQVQLVEAVRQQLQSFGGDHAAPAPAASHPSGF